VAGEQHHDAAIGTPFHRAAGVQSIRELEHHQLLDARTTGCRARLRPGSGRSRPDRYWDIKCFSLPAVNTRGNAARNSVIAPGLVSVDLSLVKSISLGAARHLEVRIEAFNLSNRPNFAVPSGRTAFTGVNADGSPIVAPTWGRITSTVTTSRQIQLGVKVGF
jgi:hypothetical protein